MAFTPEQQAEINLEVAKRVAANPEVVAAQQAQQALMHQNQLELQTASQQAQLQLQAEALAAQHAIQDKQTKLAAIQLAQNTLISNRSNQPVETREITIQDITSFADQLSSYVNQ